MPGIQKGRLAAPGVDARRIVYNSLMPQIIPTAEPFFFLGDSSKPACLLVHGFTSSPKEDAVIGGIFASTGSYLPRYAFNRSCHETRRYDPLEVYRIGWPSVEDGYHLLRGVSEKIFLVGLSMGGALSLLMSTRLEVEGVAAMSTPYEMPHDYPTWFLRGSSKVKKFSPKAKASRGAAGLIKPRTRNTSHIRKTPSVRRRIEGAIEIEMHAALPKVSVPVLLIHSKDDTYVLPGNMEKVYAGLVHARDKTKLYITGSGHVVTRDAARQQVFELVSEFIQRVGGQGLNRNLIFIALSLLTWGFGEGLFFNFQPIYLKELGSDEQQIGLILGAFGAAMAITHIPAGRLADRLGRRPLLIFAWVTGLISTIIMAMARELPLFIVGMIGYGLTAFVSSPLGSYVTTARGELPVRTALALTTATFNMGMVLGPWVGGIVSTLYGLRAVYFVAVGVFALSLVCILFIKGQPIDNHDPDEPPIHLTLKSSIAFVLRCAGLVHLCDVPCAAVYSKFHSLRTRVTT